MKTSLFALAFLLPLLSFAAEPPLTIAVFDFQSSDEAVRDLGPKLAALVTAELSSDAQLITVERAELDKALGEQELSLSGTISADSAAKVGHLTGAKVLVTGRVMKSEKETLIVAKVIGTETGRVFGATTSQPAGGSLAETAKAVAQNIGSLAVKHAAVLVAQAPTFEQRVARIKAAFGDAKRPSVSIRIPEQHLSRPVVDPAAETELAKVLQESGFTVFDAQTPGQADFSIDGEAFSERGLQRGNLVSCKARVEVKLRNLKSGALVYSDREVSVAADLGEHIAAKGALASAGAALAERLAAKMR